MSGCFVTTIQDGSFSSPLGPGAQARSLSTPFPVSFYFAFLAGGFMYFFVENGDEPAVKDRTFLPLARNQVLYPWSLVGRQLSRGLSSM